MEAGEGPNKGVLGDLLGFERVTDHHQDQPEEPSLIQLHQTIEYLVLVSAKPLNGGTHDPSLRLRNCSRRVPTGLCRRNHALV